MGMTMLFCFRVWRATGWPGAPHTSSISSSSCHDHNTQCNNNSTTTSSRPREPRSQCTKCGTSSATPHNRCLSKVSFVIIPVQFIAARCLSIYIYTNDLLSLLFYPLLYWFVTSPYCQSFGKILTNRAHSLWRWSYFSFSSKFIALRRDVCMLKNFLRPNFRVKWKDQRHWSWKKKW